MKHLITRIAIISLVAALATAAALVTSGTAAAAPASSTASYVDTMPSRVLWLDWLEGQSAWRQSTADRLLRSTFRFAHGGGFALYQPGFAPVVGRYTLKGKTARFRGSYRLSTLPSGLTTVSLAGTLDLRTGRAQIAYRATQIMVANINDIEFNQSKVSAWRAGLLLRRV